MTLSADCRVEANGESLRSDRAHSAEAPADCAAASAFLAARTRKRQILAELRTAWARGQPTPPERLLVQWPTDPSADPDVASLLYEDYCQRCRRGEQRAPEPYLEGVTAPENALASMSSYHALLQSTNGHDFGSDLLLSLPGVGEEVLGYRLIYELGRGSFARVFLAEQKILGHRPVVVKVSAIDGDEPCTLAQLQHTHIMPIYSVHEDKSAGVRAVCMPYFGGASLSQTLDVLKAATVRPTHGADLMRALATVARGVGGEGREVGFSSPPSPDTATRDGAPSQSPMAVFADLNYIRAVAWIGARLAEALEHAHQRGVLHRDVKPSNILLGADGQPMLLDFNLAQNMRGSTAEAMAVLGGTLAYMAPEQLRALARQDVALARHVDQRADIYGLGMVLFEMLTGSRPFSHSANRLTVPAELPRLAAERSQHAPSLRMYRPDIPWSLESIVGKSLAPDPAQRYLRAEHLAEDLRRFLDDRRLRYAADRSGVERLSKWVRRHPRLSIVGPVVTIAGLLLAGGVTFMALHAEQLERGRIAVAWRGQAQFANHAQRARSLMSARTDFPDHIAEGVRVCEQALGQYGVLQGSNWQKPPDWHRLEPDGQRLVVEEVRELLLLLAWGHVYLAPSEADADLPKTLAAFLLPIASAGLPQSSLPALAAGATVWAPKAAIIQKANSAAIRRALALLDRAESIEGNESSHAMWEARSYYRRLLGDHAGATAAELQAKNTPPASARDHYLLAASHGRVRDYKEAVKELELALRLDPRHYSSRLLLVDCYHELGEPAQALRECGACIVLWPAFAWGHFNEGRILQDLGKRAEAIKAYESALACQPDFADAHVNRGLLYLDLDDPVAALADFDHALRLGPHHSVIYFGRGCALEQLQRHEEADRAFYEARVWDANRIPLRLGYAMAISRHRPEEAWPVFLDILESEPRNARAIYGCGMLATRVSRSSAEALKYFDMALEIDAHFVEALRARANVRAHRGECRTALEDVDLAGRLDLSGRTLYDAACVYALCAEQNPEPMAGFLAERAIGLLLAAREQGYHGKIAEDTDLAFVRKHPQFDGLLQQASRPKGMP
jgi:serine/threonine protein kinase/tetratricopeptide (TPR) repeat protein